MENLTGYDIVCELALYTFNFLNQIVNFLAVYMNLMQFICIERNHSICYTTTTYEITFARTKIKENH